MGSQVQVWAYPPPPSCLRLGEPISWDLVLSAYAQCLEPGLAGGRSRERAASQGTYRDTAQWGGMVLKSDLMHRHCLWMVFAQKPQDGSKRLGASFFMQNQSVSTIVALIFKKAKAPSQALFLLLTIREVYRD